MAGDIPAWRHCRSRLPRSQRPAKRPKILALAQSGEVVVLVEMLDTFAIAELPRRGKTPEQRDGGAGIALGPLLAFGQWPSDMFTGEDGVHSVDAGEVVEYAGGDAFGDKLLGLGAGRAPRWYPAASARSLRGRGRTDFDSSERQPVKRRSSCRNASKRQKTRICKIGVNRLTPSITAS